MRWRSWPGDSKGNDPIERLFERNSVPRFGLSAGLAKSYGGDFGLARPLLYANFVSSADGVVALPIVGESGTVVSGNSEPDRFVMDYCVLPQTPC